MFNPLEVSSQNPIPNNCVKPAPFSGALSTSSIPFPQGAALKYSNFIETEKSL